MIVFPKIPPNFIHKFLQEFDNKSKNSSTNSPSKDLSLGIHPKKSCMTSFRNSSKQNDRNSILSRILFQKFLLEFVKHVEASKFQILQSILKISPSTILYEVCPGLFQAFFGNSCNGSFRNSNKYFSRNSSKDSTRNSPMTFFSNSSKNLKNSPKFLSDSWDFFKNTSKYFNGNR